jgi:aminocarboxymuconate-semialdehyde decarboxylase
MATQKVKVIDVHNHLFPKEWLDFLAKKKKIGSLTIERAGPTNVLFYYGGTRLGTISRPGHCEPEPRVKDMNEYGIDIQIVGLTAPGIEVIPKSEGIVWAKKINDYIAKMCQDYKGRFYALAALPYQDVGESLKELERAYKELGAKGIMMFSNINGMPIYSPEFIPIYEAAEAYDLPIFIHPAPPLTTQVMSRIHMPLPLYGFVLDTTMAVTGLIFLGVLEKFPKLKIIHAHLGGVFPYLVGRVDDCFKTYSKDHGFALKELPTDYYKRNVYVDAISFHLPAMRCALEFLGPDHILIGTDYAHPIGGPERVVGFVRDLRLPKKDCEKILWKNAARLFKLDNV